MGAPARQRQAVERYSVVESLRVLAKRNRPVRVRRQAGREFQGSRSAIRRAGWSSASRAVAEPVAACKSVRKPTFLYQASVGFDERIDRLVMIHGTQHARLAAFVAQDIASVSPETRVEMQVMDFVDPWDFEEVYGKLLDLTGLSVRP